MQHTKISYQCLLKVVFHNLLLRFNVWKKQVFSDFYFAIDFFVWVTEIDLWVIETDFLCDFYFLTWVRNGTNTLTDWVIVLRRVLYWIKWGKKNTRFYSSFWSVIYHPFVWKYSSNGKTLFQQRKMTFFINSPKVPIK